MITRTKPESKKAKPKNTPKRRTRAPKKKAGGIIEAGKAYNLEQFCAATGRNVPTIAEMEARGLKVRKDGDRVWIHGQDYLDYLETLPLRSESNHGQSPGHTEPSDHASG